jgi:hypothetical protein
METPQHSPKFSQQPKDKRLEFLKSIIPDTADRGPLGPFLMSESRANVLLASNRTWTR